MAETEGTSLSGMLRSKIDQVWLLEDPTPLNPNFKIARDKLLGVNALIAAGLGLCYDHTMSHTEDSAALEDWTLDNGDCAILSWSHERDPL